MSDSGDLVTVDSLVWLAETDKAIGFGIIGETPIEEMKKKKITLWIPKSQIDRNTMEKKDDVGEIDIPRWLAEKNNLEYID
jgi:hypothetical protein